MTAKPYVCFSGKFRFPIRIRNCGLLEQNDWTHLYEFRVSTLYAIIKSASYKTQKNKDSLST